MAVDVRALFKLVGEEGPALRLVEEAVEWLLSPKAEGIGEQLIHDAHALHGKPVTIVATATEQTAYYNLLGEHTVKINPNHISGVTLKAADGTSHVMSVERTLAHELKHAGQAEVTAEVENALEAMQLCAHQKTLSRFSEEEIAHQNSHLMHAMDAPDFETAQQHVADYVDKVALPQQAETMRNFHHDPEVIDYVTRIEAPAVDIENRVAALRGEPLRTNYMHSHDIDPAMARQMTIDELSNELELHTKPERSQSSQRSDGNSWSASLGDRSGRRLGS